MEDFILVGVSSLLGAFLGFILSLIPLERKIRKKLERSEHNAKQREDFRNRRDRILREALMITGRALFWIERGCSKHEPPLWNGELPHIIRNHEGVERQLDDLNNEMIDAYNAEKK